MPAPTQPVRLPFRFDGRYALVGRALGITEASAWVEVGPAELVANFGPWRVRTRLANVTGVEVSGPYAVARTIGPAHLSFSDRGLTFATNPDLGACISFREPVRGMDPFGLLRHPGLTVTVADPERLAELLEGAGAAPSEVEEERAEQAAEDRLHTMTAAELRRLAKARDVEHPASLSRDELVALLDEDLGPDLVDELGPDADADAGPA